MSRVRRVRFLVPRMTGVSGGNGEETISSLSLLGRPDTQDNLAENLYTITEAMFKLIT